MEPRREDIRLQVLSLLASQHIQNNAIGNQLHVGRVFLKSGGEGSLCLGDTTQVDLSDSLPDDRERCGGTGCGGKLLEHVESRLVALAALYSRNT